MVLIIKLDGIVGNAQGHILPAGLVYVDVYRIHDGGAGGYTQYAFGFFLAIVAHAQAHIVEVFIAVVADAYQ